MKKIFFLLFVVFLLPFQSVYARPAPSQTGNLTSGVVVSNTFSTPATVSNLSALDANRAGTAGPSYQGVKLRSFGVSIPAGSIITGISLHPYSSLSSAGSATLRVSISSDSGISYTVPRTQSITNTSEIDWSFGGDGDLWGRSWTISDFSDTGFYVFLECKSDGGYSCRVDYFYLVVYYTVPTSTPTSTPTLMPSFTPEFTLTPSVTPEFTATPSNTLVPIPPTVTPEPTLPNGFTTNQSIVFGTGLFLALVGQYMLALIYILLVVFNVIPSAYYGVSSAAFFLVGIMTKFSRWSK